MRSAWHELVSLKTSRERRADLHDLYGYIKSFTGLYRVGL